MDRWIDGYIRHPPPSLIHFNRNGIVLLYPIDFLNWFFHLKAIWQRLLRFERHCNAFIIQVALQSGCAFIRLVLFITCVIDSRVYRVNSIIQRSGALKAECNAHVCNSCLDNYSIRFLFQKPNRCGAVRCGAGAGAPWPCGRRCSLRLGPFHG